MGIELKNITKRFGDTLALDNVCLNFAEPKIYGLLGNNGAGKTTLLNIITNRLFADSGEVMVDNEPAVDNDHALNKLFMLSEKNLYPDGMKVNGAFEQAAIFYKDFSMEQALEMTKQFGLNPRKRINTLSTGYTSIFKLIVALNVNTPYLILDEPVLGLDAQHRDLFYKLLLEKYANSPQTIIISTHLIAEVASLIEQTIIIREGKILRDMPSEELLSGGYTISGPAALVNDYISGKQVITQSTLGGLKTACLAGKPEPATVPENLELGKLNLQDYFIQLMNKEDGANE
ncbi:MAG: ABC transporter ATP-binding protein [Firmicutes bacterium]|nr:ABC transporter ATP-binding protein [Bacillota bacterium]